MNDYDFTEIIMKYIGWPRPSLPNAAHVILINPNPLAILAKNLPQSAKIQHHAQTLPPNCWT